MKEEMLAKLRQAKSPEELIALAKENGMEMAEEEAKALFDRLRRELSDEELTGVAGGSGESLTACPQCKSGNTSPSGRPGLWVCGSCGHAFFPGGSDPFADRPLPQPKR